MREREIHTVLDGGEGEASWEEEKKKAQDRPIRLTAALRHLASVPSPPPQPPTIAPSRSPPNSAAYSHHNLSFSRSLLLSLSFLVSGGADATAQAYLAMWALYMGNKVGKGANGVSLSLLQREVEAR
jgi:hypothetical protein